MRFARTVPPENSKAAEQPFQTLGIEAVDIISGVGLARGRLHEIYALEEGDSAAVAGFAAAVTACLGDAKHTTLWLRPSHAVRSGGLLQASGWSELGGIPSNALIGQFPDGRALLRAAVDALRCPALRAVVVEAWGAMPELDLTASRRLVLAAEKSGVPLLLLRMGAVPVPSAAQTRWQVASAPSRALPGNAPGLPTFDVTLLRQRGGPADLAWRLEWDRDQRIFRETPLSGAVVSVPADRPVATGESGAVVPVRRNAA